MFFTFYIVVLLTRESVRRSVNVNKDREFNEAAEFGHHLLSFSSSSCWEKSVVTIKPIFQRGNGARSTSLGLSKS